GAALDLLKTQIENQPKSSQSNRQKPEITSQAYQSRVLRSLQVLRRPVESADPHCKSAAQRRFSDMRVIEDDRAWELPFSDRTMAVEERRIGSDAERFPGFEKFVRIRAVNTYRVIDPNAVGLV
ncbi:hypothetical protein OQ252_13335, partial [Acetobacter farinalis]|nr:hypothetical protein [Acetobacter farinalis]